MQTHFQLIMMDWKAQQRGKEANEEEVTETHVIDLNETQWRLVCKHGLTMLMMYQATNDQQYLQQARLDLSRAKSIKATSFNRPKGVLLAG